MLLGKLILGAAVARQAGHGSAHRAHHAVADALAQVADLPVRLLRLALLVLLAAGRLEVLAANQPAQRLLRTAQRLVPAAGLAVAGFGVRARGGDVDGAGAAARVREVVLDVGFGGLVGGLFLWGVVSEGFGGDGREGRRTLSAVLPVREPTADCTVEVAEST